MNRIDRATPVLRALQRGPLTREQLAPKIGATLDQTTSALSKLKRLGRVRKAGHRAWELTSAAEIAPSKASPHAPRGTSRPTPRTNGAALRWLLGSDGSVRIEQGGAGIDLTPEQFDTLKRAHQVVAAARLQVEV